MPRAPANVESKKARVETLERAVSAQAELIVELRRRIEMVERRPVPEQRPDLAGILARR